MLSVWFSHSVYVHQSIKILISYWFGNRNWKVGTILGTPKPCKRYCCSYAFQDSHFWHSFGWECSSDLLHRLLTLSLFSVWTFVPSMHRLRCYSSALLFIFWVLSEFSETLLISSLAMKAMLSMVWLQRLFLIWFIWESKFVVSGEYWTVIQIVSIIWFYYLSWVSE
jgi:hypothetical protein